MRCPWKDIEYEVVPVGTVFARVRKTLKGRRLDSYPDRLPRVVESDPEFKSVVLEGHEHRFKTFHVYLRFGVPVISIEYDVDSNNSKPKIHPALRLDFYELDDAADLGIYVPEDLVETYRENKKIYKRTLDHLLQSMSLKNTTLLDEVSKDIVYVVDWKWVEDQGTFSLYVGSKEIPGYRGLRRYIVLFLDESGRPTLAYMSMFGLGWKTLTPPTRAIDDAALKEFNERKRKADEPLYDDRPAPMPPGDS